MLPNRRRPLRSQHFFHNRQLVSRLVRQAQFGQTETVIEIGPGKGIITQELLTVVRIVIGVEIDQKLCQRLKRQFADNPRVVLVGGNFLEYPLPQTPYHVFANTPFEIEGKIIRKLLDGVNPPESAYLVTMKAVGERWCGARHESEFAIAHKPWFEMAVIHRFHRSYFNPPPQVETVMIAIKKRAELLLPWTDRPAYQQLIRQGFGGGRRLEHNLKTVMAKPDLARICQKLGVSLSARPSDLSVEQWVGLYNSQ